MGQQADGHEDFKKDPEMLPDPDAGQQPAGETSADAHAGQSPVPGPAPQGENEGGEAGDFKIASQQPPAGETVSDFKASVYRAIVDRQRVWREAVKARVEAIRNGVFKTPHWVIGAIVANQKDAVWWANHKHVKRLRDRSERLIRALDLRNVDSWPTLGGVPWENDNKAGEMLGVPVIKIEKMNVRTLGTYRPDADGYAIAGTIILNEERLGTLEPFMEMALMLMLMVRTRQHQLGSDGRLDRDGRELMKAKGLVITEKKITITKDGAFRRFLESEGIEAPGESEFKQPERKGRSTLRVWSCLCQKCRVGTKAFLAVCSECHEPFRLGDHVGKRFV